jgi:hypothetical protein
VDGDFIADGAEACEIVGAVLPIVERDFSMK